MPSSKDTIMLRNSSLKLEDFHIDDITFHDITQVRENGETLLSVAQKQWPGSQKYLNHFFLLAMGFFKSNKTGSIDPGNTYGDDHVNIEPADIPEDAVPEELKLKLSESTGTRHNILWYAIQLFQSVDNLKELFKNGCKTDTVFYT